MLLSGGDGGTVYVLGDSVGLYSGVVTGPNIIVLKLSASNGNSAYGDDSHGSPIPARWTGPKGYATSAEMALPGACSGEGTVPELFVAGTQLVTGTGYDYILLGLTLSQASFGTRRTYNSAYTDTCVSLCATCEGVYLTGYTDANHPTSSTPIDYATIAFNRVLSATLWGPKFYDGASAHENDYARQIVCLGSNLYVVGDSWGGTSHGYDIKAVLYSTVTGNAQWTSSDDQGRYDNSVNHGEDRTSAAIVDKDSNVHIVGKSYNGSTNVVDFITLSFEAAGSNPGGLHWHLPGTPDTARGVVYFNGSGSGNDVGAAIGFGANFMDEPNNHIADIWVFGSAAGGASGGGSNQQYTTIRYIQTEN